MTVAQLATSLFAANEGFLDDIDPAQVVAFEEALQAYMKSSQAPLMETINESGDYNESIQNGLRSAIEDFKANHTW
jgi:F-type H+-transporting ATPase subunit alpha